MPPMIVHGTEQVGGAVDEDSEFFEEVAGEEGQPNRQRGEEVTAGSSSRRKEEERDAAAAEAFFGGGKPKRRKGKASASANGGVIAVGEGGGGGGGGVGGGRKSKGRKAHVREASNNSMLSDSDGQETGLETDIQDLETDVDQIPRETEFGEEEGSKKGQVIFKEVWREKERRLRKQSMYGHMPGWRLLPVIVKSNDDLRQEQFAAQLIAQVLFWLSSTHSIIRLPILP
jgi:hypothetical protein